MDKTYEADTIEERKNDAERLDRAVQRLAARASAATGEYVQYFGDRLALAQIWLADLHRGAPLTPDRREGLLDMEYTADPELGAPPYRIHVSKGRVLQQVSVRVLSGKDGYFIGAAGGAEGPAYVRLSEECWPDRESAAQALGADAWTQRVPNRRQQRAR